MNTSTAVQEEKAQAIEYGHLLWIPSAHVPNEYRATRPGVGEFRVYQYPDVKDSGSCAGQWLWAVKFDQLVEEGAQPAILKMEASDIVDTREDAMLSCLDARGLFIEDLKRLLAQLCPEDLYATGFRAGQEDIKAKVAEVVL